MSARLVKGNDGQKGDAETLINLLVIQVRMASLVEMKSATVTGKGQVAIPKELRKKAGFTEGARVAVLAFSDRIELRPLKEIERRLPALLSEKALKDWKTPEEDAAWKDL